MRQIRSLALRRPRGRRITDNRTWCQQPTAAPPALGALPLTPSRSIRPTGTALTPGGDMRHARVQRPADSSRVVPEQRLARRRSRGLWIGESAPPRVAGGSVNLKLQPLAGIAAATGRHAPWRRAMERSLRFGRPRSIRIASWAHGGREEVELSGAGVVPHEVEGPGAGGDALVVADPPGAVFPAGFCRAVRVEGSGGYLPRCPEAELVWLGEEQDLVHEPVREGEGRDADPACLVDG